MKIKLWLIASAVLFLSGCTTLQDYQASCEKTHADFVGFASCYKTQVSADTRATNDSRVKLLLLKTDQLVERVQSGRITDLDAKVEFQREFVGLRESAIAEQQTTSTPSGSTTCTLKGNKMKCTPY